MTATSVHIRWLIRLDMPQVMRIENTTKFPWTEEDFLCAIRQRNVIGMVAEAGDRVAGFVIYELLPKCLRILNVAVHPEFQSQGIGTAIMDKMKGKLETHRRTHLLAMTRESNLPAQQFFRAAGFKARRLIRGFYQDRDEDGYEMSWNLEARP